MKKCTRIVMIVLSCAISLNATASAPVDQVWRFQQRFQQIVESGDQSSQVYIKAHFSDEMAVIISKVAMLSPADFNAFLFESLKKYRQEPKSRKTLNALWTQIRQALDYDFSSQAHFNYWLSTAEGFVEYAGALLMIRGIVGSTIRHIPSLATSPLIASKLPQTIVNIPSQIFGKVGVSSPVAQRILTSMIGGATMTAAGIDPFHLQRLFEFGTQNRLDPYWAFYFLQLHLGCELSFFAEEDSTDLDRLEDLSQQTNELADQNSDLENVVTDNEILKQQLAQLPKRFSNIVPAEFACRQISIQDINSQLLRKLRPLRQQREQEKAKKATESLRPDAKTDEKPK